MSTVKTRKTHPLIDTTEPNLLEKTFDYNLTPKIIFDGPIIEYIDGEPVEFDPVAAVQRDIFITDTTFRDGQQARPPFTVTQTVDLYKLLVRLTGSGNVIRNLTFKNYLESLRG